MRIFTFILAVIVLLIHTANGENHEICFKKRSDCEKEIETKRKDYMKLCGTNNVTYINQCFFEMDICLGNKISVKHVGKCRTRQPCFRELNKVHKNRKNRGFVPTCLKDGRYAPVQCHTETAFCWCVNPRGKLIPNTAKHYQKPNCARKLKTRRRASQMRKGEKDLCGPNDKQKFGENLMNLFRAEYGKDLDDGVDSALLNQKILNWKFQSIDRNDDEYLQRTEYKVLRRLKKLIKPKKCAKMFAKICDMDKDMRISKPEWSACLGVNMVTLKGSPVVSLSGQLPGLEHVNRKDEPEANDCFSDRQAVLSEQRSNNLYVPECTPDGRYNKIQCYRSTGYCWCVNEDDGKPIPGTSVKDQLPKCDSVPAPIRPMKGCPGEKKEIFLKGLMEFLLTKVISKNGTQYSMDKVVSLSFSALDSNNNKFLERKEWKTFRALVSGTKNLRRCGKRLPRFCDVNNDRRISITEWTNCLHRRGPNPLKSYLKDDD
ncbi:hypothetical protein RUM44_013613 [Polyplax serrata]|uniref:Uncharacterized protein n=1 Tax=Polyplax serrata TaxID=468196 RepID=A0ABR1BEM9_POLSC